MARTPKHRQRRNGRVMRFCARCGIEFEAFPEDHERALCEGCLEDFAMLADDGGEACFQGPHGLDGDACDWAYEDEDDVRFT